MEHRTVITVDLHPHDLIKVSPDVALRSPEMPRCAHEALSAAPWVVVRRAEADRGCIAVGVRGATRSARHALQMKTDDVRAVVTPEDLAHRRPADNRNLPALRALEFVRPIFDNAHLCWGPTGSVGFELAAGIETVTYTSDLDLLVRVPRLTRTIVNRLCGLDRRIGAASAHIDCQVETPSGAISLTELRGNSHHVLLRTPRGPRLIPRTHAIS